MYSLFMKHVFKHLLNIFSQHPLNLFSPTYTHTAAATPQHRFYVYCKKPCGAMAPGKLRVRCADCKDTSFVLSGVCLCTSFVSREMSLCVQIPLFSLVPRFFVTSFPGLFQSCSQVFSSLVSRPSLVSVFAQYCKRSKLEAGKGWNGLVVCCRPKLETI